MDAHEQVGTSILALMRVPKDQISRYGCAEIAESRGKLHRVSGLVEKPPAAEAKSDLAVMGRYVLTPAIFPALRMTTPGALGEIQLTDGIGHLLEGGDGLGCRVRGRAPRRRDAVRLARHQHASRPRASGVSRRGGRSRQKGLRVNALRREWGAVTFVVTILVGAVAVAISLGISASHPAPVASAPPCPSYTPYVVTPTAGAHRHAEAGQ